MIFCGHVLSLRNVINLKYSHIYGYRVALWSLYPWQCLWSLFLIFFFWKSSLKFYRSLIRPNKLTHRSRNFKHWKYMLNRRIIICWYSLHSFIRYNIMLIHCVIINEHYCFLHYLPIIICWDLYVVSSLFFNQKPKYISKNLRTF